MLECENLHNRPDGTFICVRDLCIIWLDNVDAEFSG